jgi:hypothetical protein
LLGRHVDLYGMRLFLFVVLELKLRLARKGEIEAEIEQLANDACHEVKQIDGEVGKGEELIILDSSSS